MEVKEYVPSGCSNWHEYHVKPSKEEEAGTELKNTLGGIAVLIGLMAAYVLYAHLELAV